MEPMLGFKTSLGFLNCYIVYLQEVDLRIYELFYNYVVHITNPSFE